MKRIAILLAFVATACTSSLPPGPSTVTLSEFAVESSAHSLEPGPSTLEIHNAGEFGHTLVITDEAGSVVAATELIQSGDSLSMPVELDAGRYELTCRIVFETESGDLVDHYERGMRSTVIVAP